MEDEHVQKQIYDDHNVYLETLSSISPVKIYPSKALAHLYSFLGKNDRLGLTGRPVTDIGYLATAKLYSVKGEIMAFTPSVNLKYIKSWKRLKFFQFLLFDFFYVQSLWITNLFIWPVILTILLIYSALILNSLTKIGAISPDVL